MRALLALRTDDVVMIRVLPAGRRRTATLILEVTIETANEHADGVAQQMAAQQTLELVAAPQVEKCEGQDDDDDDQHHMPVIVGVVAGVVVMLAVALVVIRRRRHRQTFVVAVQATADSHDTFYNPSYATSAELHLDDADADLTYA